MQLCFSKYRFHQKTTPKHFYRYRIISNNPYSDKNSFNGNSMRYQILQAKENRENGRKMFIYVLNNEYLLTYERIPFIPEFENDAKLDLINEKEYFPISEATLDLYKKWTEYYVYNQIVNYCKRNRRAYDYRIENQYSQTIPLPDNSLQITIKRIFRVNTEVMLDGTVFLAVDIKCEFESDLTIYDYIQMQKDVRGLLVKCIWQGFDKTYQIEVVHDTPITESIGGINLYDYWNSKKPHLLKNLDLKAPAVSALDDKKKRSGLYIPQSLKPVITREYIATHDKALSAKVDQYTKLSMKKRLEIIRSFLDAVNNSGQVVSTTPETVTVFGYQEMSLTKDLPSLLIANGRKIKFSEKYKAFTQGFYKLPAQPIRAAFMSYDEEAKKSYDVVSSILDYTRGKVNHVQDRYVNSNLLPLGFYGKSFHYKKGDRLSYEETAREISKISGINFAIAALPLEFDEEDYYDDSVASPYDSFKKVFADLGIPSQMVSLSMVKDLGSNNVKYRLQNLILGLLCKSGGIPWILEAPMDGVDCFIGLDVGTQEKGIHYPACSVCLDGRGNLVGYYSTNVAQRGEIIDVKSLETIFNRVLTAYKEANGCYPKHIVIHRDGFSHEESAWYDSYFGRRDIKFDVVEVRKNIPLRLIDTDAEADEMNPASGSAIIKENEAYLISTAVKSFLGAPRPLLLVHQKGQLSMESIVRQIYVLSEMHIGSMRTSRLPLTTLYADKICKHHDHVPHDTLSNKLFFI